MNAPPLQIGPYTIDRELGRGGMGVVYLARDTKLDRPIAIKALPEHLASDPDRLVRFEREARTLASLTHPNIAGIYGLEEYDGAKYLILEYVEGETLADRLDRGPLPGDEALEIASQIAAGVEAAHEQGVIHRDLKPGNVIVTPEGNAKVLDFGLARVEEASSSSMGMSQDPTITSPAIQHSPTIPGAILGTAAYMSPEQARGRRVDKRTDIWSFGVLLYEMLTGASPFHGETVSDSIGAVLHKEIDLDRLPANTPPMVRHVLRRCLERDKAKRYHDIGDIQLDLNLALTDPTGSTLGAMSVAAPLRPAAVALRAAIVLIGIALAIAVGAVGYKKLNPPVVAVSAPVVERFTKVTDFAGVEAYPTLSPDGGTVVYSAPSKTSGLGLWDIYSIRVGGFNAVNLTPGGTSANVEPSVSPDGSQIVFWSSRQGGGLFVMGATGESPRRLTDFGHNPAWSPDGSRIVFADEGIIDPLNRLTTSALWVTDLAGGAPEQIYAGDAVQPSWSPDGKHIAFWTNRAGGERDLYTIAIGPDGATGGDPVAVTEDAATDWNPIWSPDGKYLYFISDRSGSMNLWRVPMDAATGAAAGPLEPITQGGGTALGWINISADGKRLVYSSAVASSNINRLALDPTAHAALGAPTSVTSGSGSFDSVDVSPDGEWLAAYTSGREDIVLIRADGSERRRLTDDEDRDRKPKFSPDGHTILFYSDRSGDYRVWTVRTDGSRLERLTHDDSVTTEMQPRWGPNGDSVYAFSQRRGEKMMSSFQVDMTLPIEERRWEPFAPISEEKQQAVPIAWSPDGSMLLLAIAPSSTLSRGGWGLFSPETGAVTSVDDKAPFGYAVWLHDNRTLLISTKAPIPSWATALVTYNLDTGQTSTVYENADDPFSDAIAVAPDDDAVYLVQQKVESDIWVVDLASPSTAKGSTQN